MVPGVSSRPPKVGTGSSCNPEGVTDVEHEVQKQLGVLLTVRGNALGKSLVVESLLVVTPPRSPLRHKYSEYVVHALLTSAKNVRQCNRASTAIIRSCPSRSTLCLTGQAVNTICYREVVKPRRTNILRRRPFLTNANHEQQC